MILLLTRKLFITFLLALIAGCMPTIHPPGDKINSGQLLTDRFITEDGSELPLRSWLPKKKDIKAVIIALHGFNDYSHFFQQPGEYFRQQGIASYAFDQRGFGSSPNRGLWAGINAYSEDVASFIRLVREKHPGLPVYLLGESMGGAVAILTVSRPLQPNIDGIILAAPAIWSRDTMPWYQRTLLWSLAHTLPWLSLTGEGLEVMPSDNIEMLKALAHDPLVIKETRIEAVYGLANLMDAAFASAGKLQTGLLMLYGEKDEIIPKKPVYQFLRNLISQNRKDQTIAFYRDGYHMLLRDLQASVLWEDINTWINSPQNSLPSGADKRVKEIIDRIISLNDD